MCWVRDDKSHAQTAFRPRAATRVHLFVLLMALPRLSASLRASHVQQLWIVDIYGFMVAGFLLTMGTLGDRIGRRRLLLGGAVAFGAASVLAAYSDSPGLLIAARALLGLAGATLTPSTLALIANLFPDARQRGTAMGIWATCFSVGAIVGPLIGGAMLDHFWWGSVFLLGVPVVVLTLVLGPFFLPEFRNASAARVDLPSVALSLAAILPFIYGLKEIASGGWQPVPVAAAAAGITVGVVFIRRQRRLSDPLLDLRLFRDRTLTVTLGSMLMYSMMSGGTMTFLAQLAVAVAGLVVISQSAGTAALAAGFAIACFGTGPLVSLGTGLVIGSVPPQQAGSAAGLAQTGNECGLPTGVAILGSAGILAYRSYLSAHPGEPARSAAEHAFTAELHAIAAIAAIGLTVVAIVILLALRRVPPLGQPPSEPDASEQAQPGPARPDQVPPAHGDHPAAGAHTPVTG